MLIKSAGITTVINNIEKSAGNPEIYLADNKNVLPLISVPKGKLIKTSIFSFKLFNFIRSNILFKNNNKRYIIFTVTSLSIILGSCPPGNLVVKAVKIPVIIAAIIFVL